ncbi:MAG: deoxyribonuclease IV, partial [Fidelibacterota bacterium]
MGLIGAHVSTAGGIHRAPERGTEINADAIQIFTANQNQWNPRQPTREESRRFQSAMKKEQPRVVLSHDSYLINLGSPEEIKLRRSREAFLAEIERCTFAGIPYLVFHPGSHRGSGEEACLKTIVQSVDWCLQQRPDATVCLLVENTAGQGTNVGYLFEHIAYILNHVQQPQHMGVCFDTQHAFAAGYDVRTDKGWDRVLNQFDANIGLDKLKAFHVNDSQKGLGSRVDRHANIGEGLLSWEAFWWLVNALQFTNTPMVLETPAGKNEGYALEIQRLKQLKGKSRPRS